MSEGLEADWNLSAKKIRQTIYTDHYLNTITYHYTITKDQYGREVSRVLTDVTETGYIWQRRTQESRDITVPISAELNQILDKKAQSIPGFKKAQDARTKLAQELERATFGV
jgi:HKD family nuclease